MRALAAAATLALLLGGCAAAGPGPKDERGEKISYNRRELESRPGLFTGKDGVWTIYRSDGPPPPPPPPRPTTLSCERGQVCDPPAEEP
jgi:hypothetical protein